MYVDSTQLVIGNALLFGMAFATAKILVLLYDWWKGGEDGKADDRRAD